MRQPPRTWLERRRRMRSWNLHSGNRDDAALERTRTAPLAIDVSQMVAPGTPPSGLTGGSRRLEPFLTPPPGDAHLASAHPTRGLTPPPGDAHHRLTPSSPKDPTWGRSPQARALTPWGALASSLDPSIDQASTSIHENSRESSILILDGFLYGVRCCKISDLTCNISVCTCKVSTSLGMSNENDE